MNVLVIGSGGREHALCHGIARSPLCDALYAAPGNPGMASVAECVAIKVDDIARLVEFAREKSVALVVVGPETPLGAGIVDELQAVGIDAFGPTRKAAQLETSKGFMKDFCSRHGIPTAPYRRFTEPNEAKVYIHLHDAPFVVKADGLAAGKGVIICRNKNEAYAAIDHIMTEQMFGEEAGREVVIEELLIGEEVSFFAMIDGEKVLALDGAQDHKAVHDGDQGPNTGGMGAYSPAPILTRTLRNRIMDEIIRPTALGMVAEQTPYMGVLFAGLMITNTGPKLIEFNVRFGDPECQTLMMRLQSDVLDMLMKVATGRIDAVEPVWDTQTALAVVMAANGYPGACETDTPIHGVDKADGMDGVKVFHAGTALKDGQLVANGGRVLGVTALGNGVKKAQVRAYKAVDAIKWADGFCRRDIGWRAIKK